MASRGFTDSQIEAFLWIMRTRSATKAAEKMLITQPAISRLIKQLEQRLGFALFDRVNNRLLPTRKGKLFYDEVEKVYAGLTHLKGFADRLKKQVVGQFNIVSMPAFAVNLLPELAIAIDSQFPGLDIGLYSYRSTQIIAEMAAQRFDFAITTDLTEDPRYQSVFYTIPNICLLPEAHPLARKPFIQIADFNGETLIGGEPNEYIRTSISDLFHEAQITPSKTWSVSLSDMASRLVAGGKGLAIINCISAMDIPLGTVARPFDNLVDYQLQVIIPLEKDMDPLTKEINRHLLGAFEQKLCQARERFYP
ncbi:LysR substrate-binding domain-containing protein (plasmid) [Photobacterium sp. DA100]|uniref:LysR substrate-binding domain-containing protein n=1 Tax=Photobacterium sp. DA100 TaxID=3027472 RepID=UPI0024788F86|nr:LysR substrate-binding domain-containing protein [Photobacterium sp. DA100]WEM44904.1 LysR substrate-binding domain-containing protein [Photobacterium sp. DA100]